MAALSLLAAAAAAQESIQTAPSGQLPPRLEVQEPLPSPPPEVKPNLKSREPLQSAPRQTKPDVTSQEPSPATRVTPGVPTPGDRAPESGKALERTPGSLRFGEGERGKRPPVKRGMPAPSYRTGTGTASAAGADRGAQSITITTRAVTMTGLGGEGVRTLAPAEPTEITTPAIAMTGLGGSGVRTLPDAEPIVVDTPAITMWGLENP